MKKILKLLLPSVLFLFLFINILNDWESVSGMLRDFQPLPFFLAFVALFFVYPEGAYAWYKLLRGMEIDAPVLPAVKSWIISNTSRYIPGTIWQYIGRVELGYRMAGIVRKDGTASVFAEIFLSVAAAAILSILAMPFIESNLAWLVLLIPFPLVMFHPKVLKMLLDFLRNHTKRNVPHLEKTLTIKASIETLPWFALNFLINGIGMYFLITALGVSLPISSIILVSGFYAFSWLVGYVAIFAPGGVGVTEITLSYLLSLLMPLSAASVVSLVFRFMLTVTELVIFTIAYARR